MIQERDRECPLCNQAIIDHSVMQINEDLGYVCYANPEHNEEEKKAKLIEWLEKNERTNDMQKM